MSNQRHMLPDKIRVAILSPTLAPYRIPVFNRLAQLPNLELCVLFAGNHKPSESPLEQSAQIKFDFAVLPVVRRKMKTHFGDDGVLYFTPSLWSHLKQGEYDVIITLGWTMPNSLSAVAFSKFARRPVVLWEESIPHPASTAKRLLMPAFKQYFRLFDRYLAASNACINYLASMGADRTRITLLPQMVDTDFFADGSAPFRAAALESKRALGVTTPRLILFVGELTENKGVLNLLEAFRAVAAAHADVSLMLVGRGLLRDELVARRAAYCLQDRVHLYGFATQAELLKIYGAADVFVLPSRYDTFGAVICEAMACGLPIVTTDRVGAVSNIVDNGVNGIVIKPDSAPELTRALDCLLQQDGLRERMGAESLRIISHWNLDLMAKNFTQCIASCTALQVPSRMETNEDCFVQ